MARFESGEISRVCFFATLKIFSRKLIPLMYLEKYDKSFETCKNNKENDIDKSNKENVHLKLTVTKNSRSESFGKF